MLYGLIVRGGEDGGKLLMLLVAEDGQIAAADICAFCGAA